MEFGKHLKKGFWGFADKSLPAIYGLGFVVLVIRVLPKEEFGTYILIQNLFLLLINIGSSFALQPMVKYAAETDDIASIAGVGNLLYWGFVLVMSLLAIALKDVLGMLFQSQLFGELAWFLPMMLIISAFRQVVLYLFQSKIQVQKMFWINAVYFLGSLLLVYLAFKNVQRQTAVTMLWVNTIALTSSSLLAIILVVQSFSVSFVRKIFLFSYQKDIGKKFVDYGKYSLGASTSYMLYTQADSYVIASLLGPVSVALYNAAKVFTRVYDVVLQVMMTFLIPSSSKLSAQNKKGEMLVLAEKSVFVFTLFLLPAALLLWFFAPDIVTLFYKDKYPDAAVVLRILAVSGIFIPLYGVSGSFLSGIGKIREAFFAGFFNVIVAVILLYFGIKTGGVVGGAISIIIISFVSAWTYTLMLIRAGNVPLQLGKVLLRYKDVSSFLKKILSKKGI